MIKEYYAVYSIKNSYDFPSMSFFNKSYWLIVDLSITLPAGTESD